MRSAGTVLKDSSAAADKGERERERDKERMKERTGEHEGLIAAVSVTSSSERPQEMRGDVM